jgi:hypothetical protein
MKTGDKVKVLDNGEWKDGRLLNKTETSWYVVGIGEPHYFNYKKVYVNASEVKQFVEASPAQHANELPVLFQNVQETLASLLPDEKVEIKDGSVVGYHGAVTLDPAIIETQTIGRFVERAVWQVSIWKVHPATRHEPEDVSDCPVGKPTGIHGASQLFVETIFKLKLEDYLNNKATVAWEALTLTNGY